MDLSKMPIPPRDYRELIAKLRDAERWQSLTPKERATLADLAERKLKFPIGQPESHGAAIRRRMMAREVVTQSAINGRGGYETALLDVAKCFDVDTGEVREAIRRTRKEIGAENWEYWKKRQRELVAEVRADMA